MSRSALYDAVLEHERYAPAHNAFRYRIYQLLLDLDELDELSAEIPFFSSGRRNLVEVRAADHLGDPRLSIRDNVCSWLDSRGVAVPGGRLRTPPSTRRTNADRSFSASANACESGSTTHWVRP